MRVFTIRPLREFWLEHPDAEVPLRKWYNDARKAEWKSLKDVRIKFPPADGVRTRHGDVFTVFNIGGNKYRLIAEILYAVGRIYVQAVLTHAEYNRGRWKE